MPLDPQARRYLDAQAALGAPPAGSVPPEQMRRGVRARTVMTVEDRGIPGPAGSIPLRLYTPPGPGPFPVVVFFHGGGWVTGDLDTADFRCRMLARWAECLVVSVNYRHAPEHPFPAAVDDAYAATCWATENAASLRADPARIAVGGDSAGANLAAAVALLARDRGMPPLIYQYLVYPVADADFDRGSYVENALGNGLTRSTMAWYWDQYVPNPADRNNPLAAPLRATDLRGLPPALVITAEFDPLRDEGEAYAARLREAGVQVQLSRYDGMIHGFIAQTAEFDAARRAVEESVAALQAAFAPAAE